MHLVERVGRRRLLLCSLVGVAASLMLLSFPFWLGDRHAAVVLHSQPPFSADECRAPAASTIDTCGQCISQHCTFCYNEGKHGVDGVRDGWCVGSDPDKATPAGSEADSCAAVAGLVEYSDACPNPYRVALLLAVMLYLLNFAFGMGPIPWVVNSEIYSVKIRGVASGIAGTANWVTNAVVSQSFLALTLAITPAGTFMLCSGIAVAGAVWAFFWLPETKGLSLAEVQTLFARRAATSPPPDDLGEQSALISMRTSSSAPVPQSTDHGQ